MILRGHIQNGVVILDGSPQLPDGAVVTVLVPHLAEQPPSGLRRRIQVPLVRTGDPGTVDLTNDRIGEILDTEDLARVRRFFDATHA